MKTLKEIQLEATRFEKLCEEMHIPFAVFYRANESDLAGAANVTLQEISIIFESFIAQISTQELCLLLQLLTAQIQERALAEEQNANNPQDATA